MRKRASKPVAAPPKKAAQPAPTKPPEPWRPVVGRACTFYYEGGAGERYWSGGWRYGIIREVPIKGTHKNWTRVEIPLDRYTVEERPNGLRVRVLMLREKPWVFGANVNDVGDFIYHGPKLDEIVQARVEEKAADLLAAARLKKGKLKGGTKA